MTSVSDRWLGLLLAVLTLALLLGTAGDYGLTYDEPVYLSRSVRVGEWLGLLGQAPGEALSRVAINHYWDPSGDEQAGLTKLIAWPAAQAASLVAGPLAAIRAGTALVVSLLIGCLYVFVARLWGRLEGLYAALGLLAMPRVFADCHLMALDAPVMAWSGLAIMAACLAAIHGPQQRRRCWLWVALLGLAFGAAIATKVNGWFIPFIVLPWLFCVRRRVFWAGLVSMALLGPLVFIGSWPWLWYDTIPRIGRYLSFFGKHYPVSVEYFGQVYAVAPWHFALVMLLITTPVVVLVLAGVGVAGLRRTAVGPSEQRGDGVQQADTSGERGADDQKVYWQRAALGLMAWAVLGNILPSSLPSSPKYNGVRLFLPVFVPLVILAAVGLGWLARAVAGKLAKSPREARLLLCFCLILALAPGAYSTATSFPYGMSYYNLLIGGSHGAVEHGLEASYWGDTFYAAVPWLNEKAPQGAHVWINVPGFVSTMQMYQSFGLLRSDLRITAGDQAFEQAELYVVANKFTELGDLAKRRIGEGQPLYVKKLQDVPLVWVFGSQR